MYIVYEYTLYTLGFMAWRDILRKGYCYNVYEKTRKKVIHVKYRLP